MAHTLREWKAVLEGPSNVVGATEAMPAHVRAEGLDEKGRRVVGIVAVCQAGGHDNDSNAKLIALAPTAPHDCDLPSCPGAENKRKLEAAEKLLLCLKRAHGHLDCWAKTASGWDCQDGSRCPACLIAADSEAAIEAYERGL